MDSHNNFRPMPIKANPDQFILSTLLYYWIYFTWVNVFGFSFTTGNSFWRSTWESDRIIFHKSMITILLWPHVGYDLKITTTLQTTIPKNIKSKYFLMLWRPLQIKLAILGLRVKPWNCRAKSHLVPGLESICHSNETICRTGK